MLSFIGISEDADELPNASQISGSAISIILSVWRAMLEALTIF